jgi:hypothetical protein
VASAELALGLPPVVGGVAGHSGLVELISPDGDVLL